MGQSATRCVTEQIASIGSNLLFVMPDTAQRGPGGVRTSAENFDLNDVAAIGNEVDGILVAPSLSANPTVVIGVLEEKGESMGQDRDKTILLVSVTKRTRELGMPFLVSPVIMAVGFSFSVAIGVIFGYFPARKAAMLNPIDALRHE